MHLPILKKRSWPYKRRSRTSRKGLAGDIITEISLIPRRHRVNIPGRNQTGLRRASIIRTVNPKSGPGMTLHENGVARRLEKNA